MLKANHVHQKKLWVELLIPIAKRVNTLSFYFYTLTNIIYNLKVNYYKYFHSKEKEDIEEKEDSDKKEKEEFNRNCKKQRDRYVAKLNTFAKELIPLFRITDYKYAVATLVDGMNLKDKEKEAAEISEILLSNQQANNDKIKQRDTAKKQVEVLKSLIVNEDFRGHADKVFTLLKQGITTIHI